MKIYDLALRILIYRDGEAFVAHALEMDILAYGDTEKSARDELVSLICNQISFATSKNDPDMIYFPAPQDLMDRWEKAHQEQLKGIVQADIPAKLKCKAVVMPISKEEIRRKGKKQVVFDRTEGLALA